MIFEQLPWRQKISSTMPFATELEIDKIEWRTLREQYRKVSLQNGDRTQVHMKDQGNIGLDDIKQRTELEFATSMIIGKLSNVCL
jgi:hypothetical protein